MRKILVAIALMMTLNVSFAAFVVTKPAEKPVVETKEDRDRAMMEMVVKMSVKDYEKLRGKKMNFAEKFAFKMTKKRFEKQLKADDSTGFHVGAFILGFFVGIIGVLIAYLVSKDPNFRKWTWIGFGVGVVAYLLLLLAL